MTLKGVGTIIKCEHCGAEIRKSSMGRHLKDVHNIISEHFKIGWPTKPAKCDYCQKDFFGKQGLKTHIKSVHKQIKEKCGTCGKLFASPNVLRVHIKQVHLQLSRIKCHLCGKVYSKPEALRMHIKHVHDKIRYVFSDGLGFQRSNFRFWN